MSYSKRFPRVIMDYDGGQHPDYDDVAVEDSLTLFVNDIRIATLIASPEKLKELCIGYLISEGVVSSFDEIQSINLDDDKNEASIVVSSFDQVELWQEVRSSGCIGRNGGPTKMCALILQQRLKRWSSKRA